MTTNFAFSGVPCNAVRVTEHLYIGSASLNQMETAGLADPAKVEKATKVDIKHDLKLKEAQDLRGSIQRNFDGPRRRRASDYAVYMSRLRTGEILGGTPPVIVFCPNAVGYDDEKSVISIPYGTSLIALDGETQTHARYLLRDQIPESGSDVFPVMFYVGIPVQGAKQILHDINSFCTPIDKSKVLSLDGNGALTRGTNAALAASGVKAEQIDRLGTKPKKGTEISFKQANYGVAGAEVGYIGLSSKPAKNHVIDINSGASQVHINGAGQTFISDFMQLPSDLRKSLSPECVFILGAVHKEKGAAGLVNAASRVDAAFKATKGAAANRQKAIFAAVSEF